MLTHRWLGLVVLVAGSAGAQNLIPDGGFENGTFSAACSSQGLLVNSWFQASATVPGADTWTTNCAQAPGLAINQYGHFLTLGMAHGGYRFSAGYSGALEAFGTALSSPLTPGALYTLGGYFAASQSIGGAGGYAVWLSSSHTVSGTQLGVIGSGAISGKWRCDSLQFVAPAQPGSFLILNPLGGYIGTDDWYLISGTTPLYQVNQPGIATGTINGVNGTAFCPAITTVSFAAGQNVTVALNAVAYDVAYYFGPPIPSLVPPAIVLPDGQIFDLNLASVSWLCPGGPTPCFAGPLTLSVSPPVAGITITAQLVAFGVGPLGVSLSQPFSLTVVP